VTTFTKTEDPPKTSRAPQSHHLSPGHQPGHHESSWVQLKIRRQHHIVSNASSTQTVWRRGESLHENSKSNVPHDHVHSYTGDQRLLDFPHKTCAGPFRRPSMVPTTPALPRP